MSEKLTESKMMEIWRGESDLSYYGFRMAIESDREAIREETRKELLKDHFKIGDAAECDFSEIGRGWEKGFVVFSDSGEGYSSFPIRRPPKMRPMRLNEIQDALVKFVRTCDQETFNILVSKSGIPTEVPE